MAALNKGKDKLVDLETFAEFIQELIQLGEKVDRNETLTTKEKRELANVMAMIDVYNRLKKVPETKIVDIFGADATIAKSGVVVKPKPVYQRPKTPPSGDEFSDKCPDTDDDELLTGKRIAERMVLRQQAAQSQLNYFNRIRVSEYDITSDASGSEDEEFSDDEVLVETVRTT